MSAPELHAKRSPSGSAGWLECPGFAGGGGANVNSAEGSVAHLVGSDELDCKVRAEERIGQVIEQDGFKIEVTQDMVVDTMKYVNRVRDLVGSLPGAQLLVEQRVPLDHMTGETGATGTADAVILAPLQGEILIADLKFGRGVPVDAVGNTQLRMYASGALRKYDLLGDFKRVRMIIDQPRLNAVSEDVITVDELIQFEQHVRSRIAFNTTHPEARNPGEKQCRWCARKANCKALQDQVMDMFEDVSPTEETSDEELSLAMSKADMVEGWIKAIRAEVERRLIHGQPVKGFKLVEGKRGPRKWTDAKEAEAALKAMRLTKDQMYELSLISPTTAEKLAKAGDLGDRQWDRLQQFISQAEGRPSVAPESDKRPALLTSASASDFDDVSN